MDSGGGRYWKCSTYCWFWASLEPLMGETNCRKVLNPPKLVGLIAPINAENQSQQCHCLFPSPTVGCIHPILSLKERLFLTLSNPWTNILPHDQCCTHSHTTFLQNAIHAHTGTALPFTVYLQYIYLVFLPMGWCSLLYEERFSVVSHSVTLKHPNSFDLFQDTVSLWAKFIVSFYRIFSAFCPFFSLFFMVLCCYWSFKFFFLFIATLKAGKKDPDIYYFTYITRFVYFHEHLIVSDECVFVCLCLQANVSRGIYRDKEKNATLL